MCSPTLGRRLAGLCLLLGVLTLMQAVPTTGEGLESQKWYNGIWNKIRSGMTGTYDTVDEKVKNVFRTATTTVAASVDELKNMPYNLGRTAAYPQTQHPARELALPLYRFLGVDENVLHHLKSFQSPAQPAAMTMFEHRGVIFWLVTETFTDAFGAIMPGRNGRLYVYAVRGNHLMSTVVETNGAVKCELILKATHFVDFVCAERLHQHFQANKNGSGVYRMTWRGKLEVTLRRPLPTHSVRDLQVWRYQDYTFIAFLNSLEVKSVYGGPQADHLTEVTSDCFRHKSAVVDGKLFTSYNHLEKADFSTRHARSLAALVIGARYFIAVANYMGKDGNTETLSDIHVYEPGEGTRLFQRIRTSAARSWAAFSFRSGKRAEHFLVVANEYSVNADGLKNYHTDSMIYKFYRNKFVPFQCIETVGARQWVAYQGPKGEFLLAVVSGQDGVFFYQYNGWRFIQMSFQIRKAGLGSAWMGFVPGLNTAVLTLTHRDAPRPLVYYLTFQQFHPVVQEENDLRWCLSYRLGKDPREVLARVQAAPRRDRPYTFPGPLRVAANLLLAPATVFSTIGRIVVREEGYKVDHGFNLASANLDEVRAAFSRLARARAVLAASVKLDGPNINGFRFSHLRFQCSSGGSGGSACLIHNLIAGQINGQSVSLDGLVWLNRDLQLDDLRLDHADLGAGVSASVTFLSGPDMARTRFTDLVTLSGNHSISGHKNFGVVKVNSLVVSGTIQNVRVDQHTVLLTDREQTMTGDCTMQSLTVQHVRLQTLNGSDFTSLISQLVLNNSNTAITGHLVVGGHVLTGSIQTGRPASPVDPRDVARRALMHNTRTTQLITGVHALGGLSVEEEELRVVGTLNGLSVPRDMYLLNRNETVSRPVTFHTLQAASVQVMTRLGQVKVFNGQLDVLLVHGDQQVSGRKVFTDMVLLGHSSVSLTVSGYSLHNLENSLIEDLMTGLQSGRTIMGEVRFEGAVHVVDAVLGGANVTHILHNALPLHTTSIDATFIFKAAVKIVGDTRVSTHFNGISVASFALLAGNHVFTRSVTFTSDLVVEGDVHVATTVNGINLGALSAVLALTDSRTMTVSQDITLHGPSFLGGLHVATGGSTVVGGVNLQDVVLSDVDAVITGVKTFSSVRVESVTAGGVVVVQGGLVDGVLLEDLFFGNSLRKSGAAVQHLVGRSLGVVVAKTVKGTQLAAFERTVVYRDSASERLAGSLRFTGPVTIQDLTFAGSFDGVSAEEFKSGWLLKTGDQVLTGQNTLQSLDTRHLTFTGRTLQGVDFELLVKNTAKIDEVTVLHRVAFGRLMSNAEVLVNGTVQGWRLREEAVTTTAANQVVTGKKVFKSGVHYRGQFSIEQQVVVYTNADDQHPLALDIEEFCAFVMRVPAASTRIRRWIIKGDVRVEKKLLVVETFNSETVATLGTSFWLTHVPTSIAAAVFLAKVEAGANFNVDVVGKTNGQSLEGVWNNLLKRKCEAQTVEGQLTVHQLSLDHLSTPTLTNPNDDLHVADLLNILLQDGDQVITGLINFTSVEAQADVALEGTINGLRVTTDFALHGRQNVITGKKTFGHLTVLGNLSMVEGGTVQGVDVSELDRLAARKAVEGAVIVVPGTTTLQGMVYTGPHFQVDGTVDGVLLRRDTVLLRSGRQVMTGALEVSPANPALPAVEAGLIVVLDNRFNGVDLDRLDNSTVRLDRRVSIQHSITFQGVCRFNSIVLESHFINGVHLQELADLINTDYLISLGDHLGAALHAARSTREVMAVKGAEIWYYEELPFDTISKVIAVTLASTQLEAGVHDSLAGIDLINDAVYIYNMNVPFAKIYPAVKVLEPIAVTGLGSALLATCGRQPMEATPTGTHPLPKFSVIHLEGGTGTGTGYGGTGYGGTGYGHIYSMTSEGGLLAAFETKECRDLVSFQLPDGRVCLAVLNYRAATSVLCGTASTGFHLLTRLDTTRAAKGVWVSYYGSELLLVAQEPSQTETGILGLYKYNSALNQMMLVNRAYEQVSSHVTATVHGGSVLVAVTGKRTALCDTFVEVFLTNTTDVGHNLQRLEVPEAVHSSLIQLHTGEVVLMVQTRHSLYHYYMRGSKFVFVREMKTASSLCPWSTPFLAGQPQTLLIAHAGLGAYQEDYKSARLTPVATTIYRAVYRGPSFTTLYRGKSHHPSSLHAHHHQPSPAIHYQS